MPTKRSLRESGFSLGKVTGKNRWRARIVQVGAGSSGFYTEAALRDTGPAAFPVGTKINADHQGFDASFEHPSGSITTLMGAIVTEPEFVAATESIPAGLEADVEFGTQWSPFVEQFHEILGMSINAYGWGDQLTEAGLPIIEGFIPDPLNTVDVVTVAGAGGKLMALQESYKGIVRDKMDSSNEHGKDNGMTPEEIQALAEALAKAIAPSFTELKEALAPKPATEPEKAEPDMAAVVEAVVEAKLPKTARAKVMESVKGGAKVEDAIAAEQTYIKDITESIKTQEDAPKGKITEDDLKGDAYVVGGWGN